MSGPPKRFSTRYFLREVLGPSLLALAALAAMFALGVRFLGEAKQDFEAHQVWLDGVPTDGILTGSRSTWLLGAVTSYSVEVRYEDPDGHEHVGDESFSTFFEGVRDDAPLTLRVSRSNPERFSTSGREANWLSSLVLDGAVGLFLCVLAAVTMSMALRSGRLGLARMKRISGGKWVAAPRRLDADTPDFTWVVAEQDLVLCVEFEGDAGIPERLVVGSNGEPFAVTAAELTEAIAIAASTIQPIGTNTR